MRSLRTKITDVQIISRKAHAKKTASENPDQYYAVDVLKSEGYVRGTCTTCGTFFWSVNKEQTVCGDASCQGGFTFLEDNPAQVQLSYIDVWKKFSELFVSYGYKSINRFRFK